MNYEIERKFLLSSFPQDLLDTNEATLVNEFNIHQTYLGIGNKDQLRVRFIEDTATQKLNYTYAFKKKLTGKRIEQEEEISSLLYTSLLQHNSLKPLVKTRKVIMYNGYTVEIDIYKNFELIVAEIEFETEKECNEFEPFTWLGEDVTENKKFGNIHLWELSQFSADTL